MTENAAPASSAPRIRVSTGYARLDEALQGGFVAGSMVVLNAPASDEVPILLRNFVQAAQEGSLLICRTLSQSEIVTRDLRAGVKSLVCSDRLVPSSTNVIPGKGIDNLTDVNLQINEALSSIQPKRVVLDILSDVLLRHKGLQTRKWLTELLERLRTKNITTLSVLNPYMHSSEDVQAVVDLFDGNLEIIEEKVEGTLRKFLRVRWMHGAEVAEKEFLLMDLISVPQPASQQAAATTIPLKEPRWLTPLVSRTEEFARLEAAFENALEGRGSVVALQGEAGVGKTRLMQELAVHAQSKSATVLAGSASEDGLPYAPWIEIARQYVAQAPGELLRRILGANASELVKLVPDLTAKLGTIPPSKPLGEQQDKLRFYEAVTQFFIATCKESPLLLLFDDMQYVDQPSLDLLEYYVRSTSNLRVLTICSYPSEEVQSDSPLSQTMMKFNKQRLLETVSVKNLNKEETVELIKQTFGEQTVSPEFADLIYTHTGGNPFFVEEVLRSLVEDGTIFRTEKRWDRKPIQDIVMPQSVKSALKSRLTKIDQETVSVLTLAAVVGFDFDFHVLREAAQVERETLLRRVETALSVGLVQEVPRQKNMFRFADGRIRQLLLDDLSQLGKADYHVKIAESIEKVYQMNLQNQAEALAGHFSEAGDTERTIKYSVMAGDRNHSLHAYQEAIKNYTRAVDLIEEGNDAEKAAIFEKLGDSYVSAGRFENSIESYERALALTEKIHDFRSCARITDALAYPVQRAKGFRHGISVLRQGLRYVEGAPESFEAASIYSRLASLLALLDEFDESNTWSERALEAGEKSGNFAAVSGALSNLGSYFTDTGRIDEGLPLWERGLEVALQHGQYLYAAYALTNLALYTYPRDLSKARSILLRKLDLDKKNSVYDEANSLGILSILDW